MRELPKSDTFWNLFTLARARYLGQIKENPRNTRLLPLVTAVLDENGMANDPARTEIISDLCSALGSWNRDQLNLFNSETPSLHIQ